MMGRPLVFLLTLILIPPQSGLRVELSLYLRDGAVWHQTQSGICVTDAAGRCEIRGTGQAWEDGLLRGVVSAPGVERAVIWGGGRLEVRLGNGEAAGEAGRYDYLEADASAPAILTVERRAIPWSAPLTALIFLFLTGAVYRKARQR